MHLNLQLGFVFGKLGLVIILSGTLASCYLSYGIKLPITKTQYFFML